MVPIAPQQPGQFALGMTQPARARSNQDNGIGCEFLPDGPIAIAAQVHIHTRVHVLSAGELRQSPLGEVRVNRRAIQG